jgi:hypothetical protein
MVSPCHRLALEGRQEPSFRAVWIGSRLVQQVGPGHRRNRPASHRSGEWYHNRYHWSTEMEGGLDGFPGTPYGARRAAKTRHQSLSQRTSAAPVTRHWAHGSCSSSRSQQGSGKDPRCRPTTPRPHSKPLWRDPIQCTTPAAFRAVSWLVSFYLVREHAPILRRSWYEYFAD